MDLVKLFTEKNVGGWDRIARIAGGFVLIVLAFLLQADFWLRVVLGIIGLALLLTGILRHCTPYVLLGWNTFENEKKRKR